MRGAYEGDQVTLTLSRGEVAAWRPSWRRRLLVPPVPSSSSGSAVRGPMLKRSCKRLSRWQQIDRLASRPIWRQGWSEKRTHLGRGNERAPPVWKCALRRSRRPKRLRAAAGPVASHALVPAARHGYWPTDGPCWPPGEKNIRGGWSGFARLVSLSVVVGLGRRLWMALAVRAALRPGGLLV